MKIAVLGAGGHGQVIASVLALDSDIQYEYYDDFLDYPDIIDCPAMLFIVAIGDNEQRAEVFYSIDGTPQTVYHPSVMIPFPRVVGEGTFVNAGVIINTSSQIGDNVILNTGAIVEHHCIIHNHAHIAPGAVLCGGVEIGEGALVGANATVLPGMKVPEWSTVRAGSFMEIKMSSPDINEADKKAVMEVLDSGWLSMGSKVTAFEEAFADYIGVKYAVAVSNGTCGLHLTCKIFERISHGYMATTPFSFVASATMIKEPVFIEVDEKTLNIGTESIPTIPVLAVDVFGQPYDADKIKNITIEDACEALGSEYKGRKAGTLGDISVFAFYPNKQITTGEGGMICTDNKEWADLCKSWRNQGRGEGDDWFNHVRIGYNYRMDEMSAALGLSQLSRIEELLQKREQVADWYNTRLKDYVQVQYISPNTTRMSWFVYVIQVDNRDELAKSLADKGIPTRNYFKPIHLMPMYGYEPGSFPVAERAGERCLALPFSGVMTEKQVDYVCKEVICSLQ